MWRVHRNAPSLGGSQLNRSPTRMYGGARARSRAQEEWKNRFGPSPTWELPPSTTPSAQYFLHTPSRAGGESHRAREETRHRGQLNPKDWKERDTGRVHEAYEARHCQDRRAQARGRIVPANSKCTATSHRRIDRRGHAGAPPDWKRQLDEMGAKGKAISRHTKESTRPNEVAAATAILIPEPARFRRGYRCENVGGDRRRAGQGRHRNARGGRMQRSMSVRGSCLGRATAD